MLARFGLLLALGLAGAQAAEVVCYAPDGETRAPNETYVPCNKLGITQSGVFSSCCRLDGNATDRDLCTTSGLCLNRGIVQREFCTDRTWKSPACVNVCTDPESGGSTNGTAELTPCTDGTYCCGHNNLTCCGTSYAVKVPIQASVIASEKAKNDTSALKNTAIGLGAALGVVSILFTAAILWLMRKNKSLRWRLDGSDKPVQSHWEPQSGVDEYNDSYRLTPTSAKTFTPITRGHDSGQYKPIQHSPAPSPSFPPGQQDSGQYEPMRSAVPTLAPSPRVMEVEGRQVQPQEHPQIQPQTQPSELPHYASELDGGDAPMASPRKW
ncbi:Fc.00g018560.m01.CDS01 [Cosmosporella sp. VM-42]